MLDFPITEIRMKMAERIPKVTEGRLEMTPFNAEMICVTSPHVWAWLYYFEAP